MNYTINCASPNFLNIVINVGVLILVLFILVAGLTKLYENVLIKKSVNAAIEFAENTGKTGKDKLVRAVTFIENIMYIQYR